MQLFLKGRNNFSSEKQEKMTDRKKKKFEHPSHLRAFSLCRDLKFKLDAGSGAL